MKSESSPLAEYMDKVMGSAARKGFSASDVILAFDTLLLSKTKFALEDLSAGDLVLDLAPLRSTLYGLRSAALEERPELAEDEMMRWLDDILGEIARVTGVASQASGDEDAAFLAQIEEALCCSAEQRAERFGTGGPLNLESIYSRLERLQGRALDDGGLSEACARALADLRAALVELGAMEDRAGLYVSEYVKQVHHFLRDEELLARVSAEERAQIDLFLD